MSIERFVTILSPLFTALAGALVAWVAKNFPGGPQLDPLEVSGLFALGALGGISAVLKWLHGRAHYVQLHDTFQHERAIAAAYEARQPALEATIGDFERVLTAHEGQIVAKVGALVKAPPSALQVADEILAAAAAKASVSNPARDLSSAIPLPPNVVGPLAPQPPLITPTPVV